MTRFASWFTTGMVLFTGIVCSGDLHGQTNPVATVEFSHVTFTVGENAGVALITVRRSGPTNSAVSVRVNALPVTASANEFSVPVTAVDIPAAKMSQTFSIRIVDDYEEDGTKTVRLVLSDPTGGAVLGAISSAELVITDNESRQAAWLTFGLDRLP